jgi:YhcH/YjgK/YiaL family protein
MIVDYIDNLEEYKTHRFYHYLKQIQQTNWQDLSDGKVVLNNDDYYGVNTINTKDKSLGFWESHKKYVDIHYIIEGQEIIGYENINNLLINKSYDEQKDLITYFGELANPILMKKGMFIILTQQDAHMPNISHNSTPNLLKKVVYKVV